MLSNDQLYVLNLLRESLGLTFEELVPQNVKYVSSAILRSGIVLTVYLTIKSKGQQTEELEKNLTSSYFATLKQSVNQEYEGTLILKTLSEAGLKCIGLKGWELRNLYPKKHMRQMADLDILVRPYQFNKIKPLMLDLGFTSRGETPWMHDNFTKEKITVEMHKRLSDDNGAVCVWEKEMWDRAIPDTGNIYKMSREDYYLFHFIHLYKDFVHGSLGLRRIVDTWLLLSQPVDMVIVKKKLEQFGMWIFHERMVHTCRVTMGEEAMDANAEILLNHAFEHGIYGTSKSLKVGEITSSGSGVTGGKLKIMLESVFLHYGWMKIQYPILERWPVLLPYCWLKRIVRYLRARRKGKRKSLDFSELRVEDYEEMKRFYEAGGVDISGNGLRMKGFD